MARGEMADDDRDRDRQERIYRGREDARDLRQERSYRAREDQRDEGIERWQGTTEAQITALGATVAALGTAIDHLQQRLTEIQIEQATIKTRVGTWSALGGLVGAGIVSAIVFFVTGQGHH